MHGEDKVRDMARSVLPSTRRKSARTNIALAKRHGRRVVNRSLRRINNINDYYDDGRVLAADLDYYPYEAIREAVWERRTGDKLGAIMRWAPAVTHGSPTERYGQMKKLLPDSLIGRHALSHIKSVDEFVAHYEHDVYYRKSYAEWAAQARESRLQAAQERAERIRLFRGLIETHHAQINAVIRNSHKHGHTEKLRGTMHFVDNKFTWDEVVVICTFCDNPRYLRGLHDVESWVQDVFYYPNKEKLLNRSRFGWTTQDARRHDEWKAAIEKWLVAWAGKG